VNTKPGEVYLVDLGMAAKVRPAVVVSRYDPDSPRALAVLVPLTTENRGSAYEIPLGKGESAMSSGTVFLPATPGNVEEPNGYPRPSCNQRLKL
jgi:mRNA interferase MazF